MLMGDGEYAPPSICAPYGSEGARDRESERPCWWPSGPPEREYATGGAGDDDDDEPCSPPTPPPPPPPPT